VIYDPSKLLLIAGPCSLEREEVALPVAEVLASLQASHPDLKVVFKASYDKANRTSLDSPRGPGIEAGLALLQKIGENSGLPLLTDVHTAPQAAVVNPLPMEETTPPVINIYFISKKTIPKNSNYRSRQFRAKEPGS